MSRARLALLIAGILLVVSDRLVVCLPRKKDDADHTAPAKAKTESKSTAPAGTTGPS